MEAEAIREKVEDGRKQMKMKRMTTATSERRTRLRKRGQGKAAIIPRNTETMQEKSDLSVCLSVSLSVCLSVCQYIYLHIATASAG